MHFAPILCAEIFKEEVGLIEKYGSGVKRTIDEIVGYGLSRPEIKKVSNGIDVNIFGERVSEKTVKKILTLLQENP